MAEVPEIDGYSDLVRIAKGGFGTVYRAHEDRHGRLVALKVLDISDLDSRARKRFARECVAMGSLSWHPNVVALYDSGITTAGRPWLAMEYLAAGSLGDRLRRGPLSWQSAVDAGIQVAGALGAAHAAGTLHRDLKPENLLVGPFGEIQLGDFGIAAVEGSSRTTTGHTTFTAAHVAPELLRGLRPDERTDVYGLASTLHTLITGVPPLGAGDGESFATQMARVLSVPARRLEGVPSDLADLLQRSLAKDPAERPPRAADLGRALQSVQAENGEAITALRLRAIDDAPPPGEGEGDRSVAAVSPDTILRADGAGRRAVSPSGGDSRPTVRPLGPTPRQDSTLPSPAPPAGPSAAETDRGPRAGSGTAPAASRRRERRVAVGAGVVVVAVTVATVAWLSRGSEPDTPPTSSTTAVTQETTAVTTVAPAELPVVVANGSGEPGAGSALTDELTTAGYASTSPPTNGPSASETTVYFTTDDSVSYETDAEVVAATIGLDPSRVEPLPPDLGVDTSGAVVVVLLGADLVP